MGFSDKQLSSLRRPLNPDHVRTREAHGREFSYIEGWHAIAEANRIFGFDGWDRETIETKCLLARDNRGGIHVVYLAKVRVSVRAETTIIVRDGYGTGEAQSSSTGEAHERALKMAETDATKRALTTFGNPFGLSLSNPLRRPQRRATTKTNEKSAPVLSEQEHCQPRQQRGADGRYHVLNRQQPAKLGPDEASALGKESVGQQPAEFRHPGLAHAQTATEAAEAVVPPGFSVGVDISTHKTAFSTDGSSSDQPTPAIAAGSGLGRLLIDWPKRHRDRAHLKFVSTQPCLICGRAPSDAHHLRFAQPRALGKKVSDEFTVPLCRLHHRQLHHSGNEIRWWNTTARTLEPLQIAKRLWQQSHRFGKSSESDDEHLKQAAYTSL